MEEKYNKRRTIAIQDCWQATKKQKQSILQDSVEKKQKQVAIQPSTPSKIEGPTRIPLPPLYPTCIAGIFSSAPSAAPSFCLLRPNPNLNLPAPFFFDIPAPFAVVSSSSGLLLIRSASTYHVINPFLHSPASYRLLPPTPRPHTSTTPAVISVDILDKADPIFHVFCAIEEHYRGGHSYTFDTFSSKDDEWFRTLVEESPPFGTRRIIASTGISNGFGMAFWLTDMPPAVVRVAANEVGDVVEVFNVPEETLDPGTTLQLGRMSEICVGLVAATQTYVILHRLELDKSWSVHGFLNVTKSEKEAGDLPGVVSVVCRWPQEQPEVIRFDRDVTMWINGRMVVWEIYETIMRIHTMPEWVEKPESIEDGVPYVYTNLAAWDFLESEMLVMREFEQAMAAAVIQEMVDKKNRKRNQLIIQDSSSEDTKRQKQVIVPVPKIKRPILAPVPPSVLSNYTYNVDSFCYHPGLSTAGIFSSTDGTFHYLRPYPKLNLPNPSFFDVAAPFSVLSSSSGLLLLRSGSTYHVLNPFIHSPASHSPIPQPDSPHSPTTPAILAIDTRHGNSVYYIICAVEEQAYHHNNCWYTFDIYSSNTGEWITNLMDDTTALGNRRIIASTGVSDGRGNAFWLTNEPTAVVKVTVGEGDYGKLINIPFGMLRPWAKLQFGKLSESCISIIATTKSDINLLRLQLDNSFVQHGFLNVKSYANEVVNAPLALSVVSLEWPGVMRFDRDVMIWINGRMVVWEIDWEHCSNRTERLHTMPVWTRRPESITDGVPYVYTERVAEDFVRKQSLHVAGI